MRNILLIFFSSKFDNIHIKDILFKLIQKILFKLLSKRTRICNPAPALLSPTLTHRHLTKIFKIPTSVIHHPPTPSTSSTPP